MAKVGRLVKDLMVQEMTTALKARPNFFVTSVGPLRATEADTLRKQLQTAQGRLLMIKRTLGLRGLASLKLNGGLTELFTGSLLLVLPGEDAVHAAKVIVDFAKANEGKLLIRGGWVDGQLLDQQRVQELASLPPRPQLVAQLVGVIESPIAELIMVLESILGELAWVLEEASKAATPAETAKAETQPASAPSTAAGETPPTAAAGEQATPPTETTQDKPTGGTHDA